MGTNLLTKLVVLMLALGPSSMAAAQTAGVGADGGLRPTWSDSAMADGWRAICGDVRNDRHLPARSIAIRVQGLDTAGQVVSTRERYITADVPAGSRAVFCVPMPAGAASYNVTVPRADWGSVEGP